MTLEHGKQRYPCSDESSMGGAQKKYKNSYDMLARWGVSPFDEETDE
jgi:hypothetical protein